MRSTRLSNRQKAKVSHAHTFTAIGTRWAIHTLEPLEHDVEVAIHQEIEGFDKAYSRFRADSLVRRIAGKPGTYELPFDGGTLLNLYRDLYQATDGHVTPLIGRLMEESGYDAEYSLKPQPITNSPPAWGEALRLDENHITTHIPVLLDLGAAGKGYLIDRVSNILQQAKLTTYVIDAGGDILTRDAANQPVTIALENPLDTSEAVATVALQNASICASSGSRRKWADYHHIIDPVTRASPREVIATWTIAKETALADGLATALFFVAPEQLRQFDFAYAVLHSDMQLDYSATMPLTLFKESS